MSLFTRTNRTTRDTGPGYEDPAQGTSVFLKQNIANLHILNTFLPWAMASCFRVCEVAMLAEMLCHLVVVKTNTGGVYHGLVTCRISLCVSFLPFGSCWRDVMAVWAGAWYWDRVRHIIMTVSLDSLQKHNMTKIICMNCGVKPYSCNWAWDLASKDIRMQNRVIWLRL